MRGMRMKGLKIFNNKQKNVISVTITNIQVNVNLESKTSTVHFIFTNRETQTMGKVNKEQKKSDLQK